MKQTERGEGEKGRAGVFQEFTRDLESGHSLERQAASAIHSITPVLLALKDN